MEREPLFVLRSRSLRYTGVEITPGEPEVVIPRGVTVVTGPNGAGKSTLARIIERGRNFLTNKIDCTIASPRVTVMEFGDIHSLSGFKAGYYQQRYEATMNDEVPSVGELLASRTGSGRWRRLVALFGLGGVEEKKVNFLSSGELRKLLVANALVDAPDLLVLDNPYIGLDPAGRAAVDCALAVLAAEGTTSLMLLLPDPDDIPGYADCVLVMDRCHLLPAGTDPAPLFNFSLDTTKLPEPAEGPHEGRSEVFSFADCPVTSADRLLIPSVTWTVCQGEQWALTGPNGSGKSTLLSLIHADNPQAYARPVRIFGKRRGTGESIWDIKKRIGYISPEMHLYFNGAHNQVADIVAQGLNDTVGMFRRISGEQAGLAARWLEIFGLTAMADRRLNTLSAGEQRMALLARTLIKNPQLLILDEPLHGLDSARKRAAIAAVDTLCRRDRSALVFVTHNPTELPPCVDRTYSLAGPSI
jgi:molybdate transport system ATP-binding protein